jgi:DNA-binding LacI/PurR family transcriptional regulator
MADVARAAGVHQTTVSRALRNDRRIPAATCRRIRALADKLNYRPHPLVSALIVLRRKRQPSTYQATIAYVASPLPQPSIDRQYFKAFDGQYFKGAKDLAGQLGYQIELFRLGENNLTPERLSTILVTRNIYGVMIGPLPAMGENFTLSWRRFCVVAIEYTFTQPGFDRVVHDSYGGMRRIMAECRRAGYRRVGLALTTTAHERTEGLNAAAYWMEQAGDGLESAVPPLILPEWHEARFESWYRRYRPEVLVVSNTLLADVQAWCARRRLVIGRHLQLANVNSRLPGTIAGIIQNPVEIGATALRMVVDKINRNDNGTPAVPHFTLTPGRWVDGETFRKKKLSVRP